MIKNKESYGRTWDNHVWNQVKTTFNCPKIPSFFPPSIVLKSKVKRMF